MSLQKILCWLASCLLQLVLYPYYTVKHWYSAGMQILVTFPAMEVHFVHGTDKVIASSVSNWLDELSKKEVPWLTTSLWSVLKATLRVCNLI